MRNCKKIGELEKLYTPTLNWMGDSHLVVADDFGRAEGIQLVEVLGSESIAEPRPLTFPESSPIRNADFVACFELVPLRNGTCVMVADYPDADGNPLEQIFEISGKGIASLSEPREDSSTVFVSELDDGRLLSVEGKVPKIQLTDPAFSEFYAGCPYPTNPENEEAGLGSLSRWGTNQHIGTFVDWQKIAVLKWSQESLDGSPETVRVFENAEHQGICLNASKDRFALMLTDTEKDLCSLHVMDASENWSSIEYEATGAPVDDRMPFLSGIDLFYFDDNGLLFSADWDSGSVRAVQNFEMPVLARASNLRLSILQSSPKTAQFIWPNSSEFR